MDLTEILAAIQAGNFDDLTDEQLAAGRAAIRESLTAHQAGTETLTDDERDAMLDAGRAVLAETTRRAETAADQIVDPIDDLVAGLTDPDPTPEPVRPSVADIAARRPPTVIVDPDPEPNIAAVEVLVAAGGFAGSEADGGETIESIRSLGERMRTVHEAYGTPQVGRVLPRVARRIWSNAVASLVVGGDSTLEAFAAAYRAGQARAQQAIDTGFNTRVLQAASGICGPPQPVYDVFTVGSATAGLIELPTVNLARGRVSYPEPLTYDDLRETHGIAYKYTSDDGAGIHGDVVKDCYAVTCGDSREFEVAAFQTCLKFGNFQGMFNAEYVGHVTSQSLMTHAHRVNRSLLTSIQDDTRTIDYVNTGDKGGGAIAQFVRQVAFHAFLYRDKYRLALDETIEVVVPYMVLGALIADGAARPDAGAHSFQIAAALTTVQRDLNVRVQFVYDYIEGVAAPGDYGDQQWRMLLYPAGTILHIGAETLDLGEVRDSTYNSRNEFGTWVETFDGVAIVGPEVMQVTALELCPNGAVGAAEAITCTSGASSS